MNMQDDETLQMYVEESGEHLADIENDLLVIEEAGADIDEDLVNKVFRAAHSIKGGAGFMGLDNIKEMAHKMENILGMIRGKEIVPNPEVINILLMAFDKLRELINNVEESNEIDITDHIVALKGLTSVSLPEEEKEGVSNMAYIHHPDGSVAFTVSEFDISQARKHGMFIYLVEYDLIHDVQNKDKTPLDIVKEMQDSGNILESKIDITAVGTLESDVSSLNRLPFLVLFASIIEMDLMYSVLDLDEDRIHMVTEDMITGLSASQNLQVESQPKESTFETELDVIKSETPDGAERVAETEVTAEKEEQREINGRQEIEEASAEVHITTEEEHAPTIAPQEKPIYETEKDETPDVKSASSTSQTSIRVHVSLLDSLMTLAGELVLSRNQLLQTIGSTDQHALELVGQKVDMVTSELQEAIMFTRMQPIGNVFNKFPRVVRDMAKNLGKEVDLRIEGKEVELDKTIIEAISDPLTHLVRNSVDHGIEPPDKRILSGKHQEGNVSLKAYHEAGQVNIEISDDGKGLDGNILAAAAVRKGLITEEQANNMSKKEKTNLIFSPGFSTAEKVTDVSGRGVGMDVVKTNLDKLGGVIDIESEPGKGTTFRIKLPLTLAIIPSQIISNEGERYAIPQVNIDELLRIPASQVKDRIERVGDAEVVRLREQLLPLLCLTEVLGMDRTYIDPKHGVKREDRRSNIADRRSRIIPMPLAHGETAGVGDFQLAAGDSELASHDDRRVNSDRRYHASNAVNIVVASTGLFKYGLVVDELYDSEEIVVKPLGRHLKHCKGYAGATIMGDGHVALILDVAGVARMAELSSMERIHKVSKTLAKAEEARVSMEDVHSLLVFMNGEDEQFAVPLDLVARIEKVKSASIEKVGGKKVIQYRGSSLPLFTIDEVANVSPLDEREDLQIIVFRVAGREVGLLTTGPVDAMEISIEIDDVTLKQTGIIGSAIIGEYTTLLIDIFEIMEALNPDWFAERDVAAIKKGEAATILLAEDSTFFRNQVKSFMEDDGYKVIEAEDGMIAWDLVQKHSDVISLVVTDIEMPNLDGFDLTARIRQDERLSELPVIALTSLAGEEDVARGKNVGIDDYQIKLDKEELMASIYNHLQGR